MAASACLTVRREDVRSRARVRVCVSEGGSTVFTRSSRLDLYGHTGVLGSGRSPL